MEVKVLAPAKINLALDIVGKRDDGYHLVKMVMQAIDLCDVITVSRRNDKEINIFCDHALDVKPEQNTAYRAAEAFFKSLDSMPFGLDIEIIKNIPVSAGLAGGSTDAAAVLVALNELCKSAYSKEQLATIGAKIGADIPFCLFGGTMLAEGIGTTLSKIKELPNCYFVLAKPAISVSTQEAYALSDTISFSRNFSVEKIIQAINSSDKEKIAQSVFNRFEEIIDLQEVSNIKNVMTQNGSSYSCMSGSGPTVFGAFDEYRTAEVCASELKQNYSDVFICRPISHGCKII